MWNLFKTNDIHSFTQTYFVYEDPRFFFCSLLLLSHLLTAAPNSIDQLSSTLSYLSICVWSWLHLCMFLAPSAHIQGEGEMDGYK